MHSKHITTPIRGMIDEILSEVNSLIDSAFKDKGLLLLLAAVMIGIFIRWYNLSYFHFMTAEESVYTQAVYAMTKGYMPYSDVFVAHPPMYLLVQYPFMLISSSLLMVRFSSVLLSLGNMILLLYAARTLYSEKVARLATIIFALSPYAIFLSKFATVENTLLFFATLVLYLFFKYYRTSDRKWLVLSGIFVGVTIMSKYSMLFLVIALVGFIVVKKEFKNLVLFMACASIVPLVLVLIISSFGAFSDFFLQTVDLQLIRLELPLPTKMWEIAVYSIWISPIAFLAFPALPLGRKKEDLFLTFLYVTPLLIMFLGKSFFYYYPLMLTPIICILAARGLDLSLHMPKNSIKKKIPILLLIGFLVLHFYTFATYLSAFTPESVTAKVEIANYVRRITNESDKIWTTEADIGFFAQRIIVTPNSEVWKFQGFYEDVWGYFGPEYIGQHVGYPYGVITLTDIRQAIEEEKPKVVVFMDFKIADYLAWNGISNPNYKEIGLAEYILAHYYLEADIYDTRIYVRK